MKKIFTIAVAFAALSFTANAQTQRDHAGKATDRMEKKGHDRNAAMKDLNLTADQQAKLKAQHQEAKAQMEALKSQNLSEEQMKAKRIELRKAQMAKTQLVLNADQQALLKKNREAQKAAGNNKEKMHQGRDMNNELGLSNDQGQKMKAINENSRKQMEAIKADNSLSDEARKIKIQEVKKSAMQSRKQILTNEQQQKAKQLKKEHKGNKHMGHRTAKK